MTYRGMLITLLAGMLAGLGLIVVSSQSGSGGLWATLNPRTILAASLTPHEGVVPVTQAYEAKDGSIYFVGSGKNALVRDPDGNVRTLPIAAMPH